MFVVGMSVHVVYSYFVYCSWPFRTVFEIGVCEQVFFYPCFLLFFFGSMCVHWYIATNLSLHPIRI